MSRSKTHTNEVEKIQLDIEQAQDVYENFENDCINFTKF